MVDLWGLLYFFDLAIALGYFIGIGGGIPLALGALLLARRVKPVSRAIAYAAVLPALGLVALAVLQASVDDPLGGVPLVLSLAVVLVLIWGVPLLVGRTLLTRFADLTPERALSSTLLGLPVGLLTSFVVFVAPGGFARRNILFLDGPVAALAWAVFFGVLVFGPTLVGMAVARHRDDGKNAVVV